MDQRTLFADARRLSLLLTLHNSPNQQLTKEQIRNSFRGYMNNSGERLGLVNDDLEIMLNQGFPIEIIQVEAKPGPKDIVRADFSSYEMPPIQFTEEESRWITVARNVDYDDEGFGYSREAWQRLTNGKRVFTSQQQIEEAQKTSQRLDIYFSGDQVRPKVASKLEQAITLGIRLHITYTPDGGTEQHRRFEPWGLVPMDGKLYCVGFDPDKHDHRMFRLKNLRINGKDTSSDPMEPRPDERVILDIAHNTMTTFDPIISAVVAVTSDEPSDHVTNLVAEAEALESKGHYRIEQVRQRDLMRVAYLNTDCLVVLEPAEVAREIVNKLSSLKTQQARLIGQES